jgi:hypothetical protein
MWALVVFTCLNMDLCPVEKKYFDNQEGCIQAMLMMPTQKDDLNRTFICVPQSQDDYYDPRLRDTTARRNAHAYP